MSVHQVNPGVPCAEHPGQSVWMQRVPPEAPSMRLQSPHQEHMLCQCNQQPLSTRRSSMKRQTSLSLPGAIRLKPPTPHCRFVLLSQCVHLPMPASCRQFVHIFFILGMAFCHSQSHRCSTSLLEKIIIEAGYSLGAHSGGDDQY